MEARPPSGGTQYTSACTYASSWPCVDDGIYGCKGNVILKLRHGSGAKPWPLINTFCASQFTMSCETTIATYGPKMSNPLTQGVGYYWIAELYKETCQLALAGQGTLLHYDAVEGICPP